MDLEELKDRTFEQFLDLLQTYKLNGQNISLMIRYDRDEKVRTASVDSIIDLVGPDGMTTAIEQILDEDGACGVLTCVWGVKTKADVVLVLLTEDDSTGYFTTITVTGDDMVYGDIDKRPIQGLALVDVRMDPESVDRSLLN